MARLADLCSNNNNTLESFFVYLEDSLRNTKKTPEFSGGVYPVKKSLYSRLVVSSIQILYKDTTITLHKDSGGISLVTDDYNTNKYNSLSNTHYYITPERKNIDIHSDVIISNEIVRLLLIIMYHKNVHTDSLINMFTLNNILNISTETLHGIINSIINDFRSLQDTISLEDFIRDASFCTELMPESRMKKLQLMYGWSDGMGDE